MSRIALIVLDTLRKDAFDEHFDWLPGMRYENAWAPSHWTVPVHASLFTGRYPSEVGASVKSQSLDCERRTLAERLSDNGYTTRAFSANPKISSRFNYDRGFDTFDGSWRTKPFNQNIYDWSQHGSEGSNSVLRELAACLRSESSTLPSLHYRVKTALRGRVLPSHPDDGAQTAKSWVKHTDTTEDEFCFLNLMEAHAPYDPPTEYKQSDGPRTPGIGILRTVRGNDSDAEALREAYDESVRYLSDVYKQIFDRLINRFDYVITIADHGELFGEHGVWEHDYGLYPELTHVPLVITSTDASQTTCDELVSLLDVHATILSLAGENPDGRGRDLTASLESKPYITEYAGLTEYKIERLRDAGLDDNITRYDQTLRGIALPPFYYGYETPQEFIENGTADTTDPEGVLSDIAEELPEMNDTSTMSLSSMAQDQLEDLGYI